MRWSSRRANCVEFRSRCIRNVSALIIFVPIVFFVVFFVVVVNVIGEQHRVRAAERATMQERHKLGVGEPEPLAFIHPIRAVASFRELQVNAFIRLQGTCPALEPFHPGCGAFPGVPFYRLVPLLLRHLRR